MATFAVYKGKGEVIDYTNSTDEIILAGQLVTVGEAIGVAGADIPVGETGTLSIEGLYEIPKDTGEIKAGERVCLKDGKAKKHEAGDSDCAWLGHAAAPAKADDVVVLVKINV